MCGRAGLKEWKKQEGINKIILGHSSTLLLQWLCSIQYGNEIVAIRKEFWNGSLGLAGPFDEQTAAAVLLL